MDTPQDETIDELNVALAEKNTNPRPVDAKRTYYLHALICAVGVSVFAYLGLSALPTSIPTQYLGFGALGVAVVILVASGIFLLATRLSKIPTRSFDKALFVVLLGQLVNQIGSFFLHSFYWQKNSIAGGVVLLTTIVLMWFVTKRIYTITHRKVLYTYLWLLLLGVAVAVVISVMSFVILLFMWKDGTMV